MREFSTGFQQFERALLLSLSLQLSFSLYFSFSLLLTSFFVFAHDIVYEIVHDIISDFRYDFRTEIMGANLVRTPGAHLTLCFYATNTQSAHLRTYFLF